MTDRLGREFWVSISLHLTILTAIFLRAVFVPDEAIQIRNSIRVEVVGLPQKQVEPPKLDIETPAEPEPVKAKEEVKPTTPEPTPKVKEPVKPKAPIEAPKVQTKKSTAKDLAKAQEQAMRQIRAQQALDSVKSEVSKKRSPVVGNQLADGNSLKGLDSIEYNRYFGQLEVAVKNNWRVPQWLADANLSAQILVKIDERGYVIERIIVKSSRNEVFDAQMITAVDESSPLPPPPSRLQGLLSSKGVVFRFPE